MKFYSINIPSAIVWVCMCLFYFTPQLKAQQTSERKKWTTANPFNTDVFVENYGQFNNWINASDSVKYAINNSEKIFFLPAGIIYRLDVVEKDDTPQTVLGKDESENEHHEKLHTYYVKMLWQGCNANAEIEASGESQGYYTFGEKGYENIKAKGYNKIVYNDLYPGIDAEYTIAEKGGIKYKLIVNPGADLNALKMQYSGDIENIFIDSIGNITIKTAAGNIIDHAPQSFYEANNIPVSSAFELNDSLVSFKLKSTYTQSQTIIVDPWTTVPATLLNDNAAYDIAYDDYGNVWVSGGTTSAPYYLAKYSASGNIIWTFTNPLNWSATFYCYSKFCILPHTGTTFMGEGLNGAGPRIMKISKTGIIQVTSPNFPPNNEIWLMFYNRCTGKLMAFGGGTQSDDNIHIIADTNLTSGTSSNFNTCFNTDNDIASALMDYNGDFYSLMSSQLCSNNNHLMKSLISSNYTPPLAFDINTGYDFFECTNNGIPSLSDCSYGATVRANALALNINYLFSYDGKTLIAWDKINGNQLGSVVVDPVYKGGQYRSHEGIAVDDCNNVYVGGTNKVHVFKFDGSAFTAQTPITTSISNEVYDVSIDETTGILYICGLGFVTTMQVFQCVTNQLTLSIEGDCTSSMTVNASGGTPPYSYLWSNGSTSSTIVGPSGFYTVTVFDNSCKTLKAKDSVELCTLTIPNVFTPNADNKNDVFEIIYDGSDPFKLKIFNRWGKIVYTTKNKDQHWNGKTPNGKDAADGVYYYVLDIGVKNYHGTVTLLR